MALRAASETWNVDFGADMVLVVLVVLVVVVLVVLIVLVVMVLTLALMKCTNNVRRSDGRL